MTGSEKPGDAVADKWQERIDKLRKETDLPLTRLEVRAELKSAGEEELSDVIDRETLERQRVKQAAFSDPPTKASPSIIVLTVVRKFSGLGALIVALAAIAAYVAIQLLKK